VLHTLNVSGAQPALYVIQIHLCELRYLLLLKWQNIIRKVRFMNS